MEPTAGGADLVGRYAVFGPFLAAFTVTLLATAGDKGQIVVAALASRYEGRRVYAGAMIAFALWSAVEVAVGQWLLSALPTGAIEAVTAGLFIAFGGWMLYRVWRAADPEDGDTFPPAVATRVESWGGVVTSFAFVMVGEVGDKTQILTINLAATFSEAPLAVFAGVVAGLGVVTGISTLVGDRVGRLAGNRRVRLVAGAVFLAIGVLIAAPM